MSQESAMKSSTSHIRKAETAARAGRPGWTGLREEVIEAIGRTQSYYLNDQHPDGYWWYELESNVTITAEYLMLLAFLGKLDHEKKRKIANYLRERQRGDGSWAIHWNGKGDVSASVEAYLALRLADYGPLEPAMQRAREFILNSGGVEATRVFTKIFLALFGQLDWKAIPSLPVEIMLLPHWFPCSIYSFSSWARSTLVPLSLILDAKPVRWPAGRFRVDEIYRRPGSLPPVSTMRTTGFSWKRFFLVLDGLLKQVEDRKGRFLRAKARERALAWVIEHQEITGDWAGIQPAMVNSILALCAAGFGLSSSEIRRGLAALEGFTLETDGELALQPCISPVWDTALTSLALLDSNLRPDHPSLIRSRKWLLDRQILARGDWSVKKPFLEPGGWAFEFTNNWYPDVDDTAVVLMFLLRSGRNDEDRNGAIKRGAEWLSGMQGKDGGWGAFDADNNMALVNEIPFADLEAMLDPSTADVTGRVLGFLGEFGCWLSDDPMRSGIAFLKKMQEKDGLWWGRWGVNYVYGTWSVLAGLRSAGEDMEKPYIRRAIAALKTFQNQDGGWGECCESYNDSMLRLKGGSTPSQTAWGLMSLIAGGEGESESARKAVRFLLDLQRQDGTWEEEWFTATGFPKYFMLKYHNYRNCFPLMALGQFHRLSTLK
jgi:squalene-hopene/tetraprenyl-beta-curcumene cyclase